MKNKAFTLSEVATMLILLIGIVLLFCCSYYRRTNTSNTEYNSTSRVVSNSSDYRVVKIVNTREVPDVYKFEDEISGNICYMTEAPTSISCVKK